MANPTPVGKIYLKAFVNPQDEKILKSQQKFRENTREQVFVLLLAPPPWSSRCIHVYKSNKFFEITVSGCFSDVIGQAHWFHTNAAKSHYSILMSVFMWFVENSLKLEMTKSPIRNQHTNKIPFSFFIAQIWSASTASSHFGYFLLLRTRMHKSWG